MKPPDIEDIELRRLLEGIFQVYGWDFRGYAEASLRRRLTHWLEVSGIKTDLAGRVAKVVQRLEQQAKGERLVEERGIQRHGGKVWMEGKVGEGATLYFTLPKHPQHQPLL